MQGIHDLKAALPRMPRTSKKVSSEERAEAEYNDTKCDARVWLKGGFAAQCRCKKVDGQFLCKRHQNEADKHSGLVKNGFFNAERPTHHYGNTDDDKAFIPWHDVLDQMPVKKTKKSSSGSSGSARKCGTCGEIGHNKRKCPHAEADTTSMSVADLELALDAAKAKEVADAEAKKALEEQAALFAAERSGLLDRLAKVSLAKSLSEYIASGDEEPCRTWDGDLSVDPEERDIEAHSERN